MYVIFCYFSLTWHCCGPCLVGDAVFGLGFFAGVDDTVFADCIVVAAIVVVSGCWADATIDANEAVVVVIIFCATIFAIDVDVDEATDSITLATKNRIKRRNWKHKKFHTFQ